MANPPPTPQRESNVNGAVSRPIPASPPALDTPWDASPPATTNSHPAAPGNARASGLFPRPVVESIVAALEGLDFGSVEITVHNSRIVQIERHQRIRFSQEGRAAGGKEPG